MDECDVEKTTPTNRDEFVLTTYQQCFTEKQHYDTLSWTIGSILIVFSGGILAYLPRIRPAMGEGKTLGLYEFLSGLPGTLLSDPYLSIIVPRVIIGIFAWVLITMWYRIYERNRTWAEICNQKIRDIERTYNIEGIGIRFLKDNGRIRERGCIVLRNTDEKDKLAEFYRNAELEEQAQAISMHLLVPQFRRVLLILLVLACLVP